ncbi:hypothetical protein [Streptomyces sp. GQFP]|uniref:hypothetical protein n=1 Tax=Streptomyces sp. GQFP TaxID=2907545 RepID=UPI001F47DFB6|nr:hypothetical protein [Streptomyces sp. GQFP]UIX33335.1 hypothetical protein LUX31_26840 [Streptomyces sp. GQFP]
MDIDDLRQLASHLEEHCFQVVVNEAELRLHVTNPRNSRLTEEIVAVADRYVTGFDYEIGERGAERECADRIARMLAVGVPTVSENTP